MEIKKLTLTDEIEYNYSKDIENYYKTCKNVDHNKIINFKNKTISCVCEERKK